MENTATKIRDILFGVAEYQQKTDPNALVINALHSVIGGETQAHSIAAFLRLITQTRESLKTSETVSDPDAYLDWESAVVGLISFPGLAQPVQHHLSKFVKGSSTAKQLTVCSDQIKGIQAKNISNEELQSLQSAAEELQLAIQNTSVFDQQSRRTLLRIVRLLLDSIQSYRFGGSEELRKAIEQFVGGVITAYPLFLDFEKRAPENQSAFRKTLGVVGRVAVLIKPVAEGLNQLVDLAKKFELLSDKTTVNAPGPAGRSGEVSGDVAEMTDSPLQ
jgi:hypothetical protein